MLAGLWCSSPPGSVRTLRNSTGTRLNTGGLQTGWVKSYGWVVLRVGIPVDIISGWIILQEPADLRPVMPHPQLQHSRRIGDISPRAAEAIGIGVVPVLELRRPKVSSS